MAGPVRSIGAFIQSQRRLANLSLRQLAELAKVSNAYLSQIERGIYKPSAKVLKHIGDALGIAAERLYSEAGLLDEPVGPPESSVEKAILLDLTLTDEQKEALVRVYR